MSSINTWNEPFLPWVESENDRRFKRILRNTIIITMVLGVIVGFLPRPEIEQKELKDVSPRLAKLIIEKKKAPPPPPPKVTKKKKVEKKKKTAEKKKPKTKKEKSARKKAEKSGILAMSDQLADLRDSFDTSTLSNSKTLQKSGKSQSKVNTSAVITAKSNTSSGGINTKSLSRSTGGGSLAGIQSSNVKSSIPSGDGAGTSGGGGRSQARSDSEVQLVFQKNAGAIDSMYNRALRKDPSLQGKVMFQLVIAPNGKVLSVKIISSELNNPKLESRLKSRIKLFRFPAKNVAKMTINYPIDFFPS